MVLATEYCIVSVHGHGHAQSRRAEETPEQREGGFSEIGSDGNGESSVRRGFSRETKASERSRATATEKSSRDTGAAEVRLQGRREQREPPSHHNYASVTSSSSSFALLCSDSCALTFFTPRPVVLCCVRSTFQRRRSIGSATTLQRACANYLLAPAQTRPT